MPTRSYDTAPMPSQLCVLLHGLGADGRDLQPLCEHIQPQRPRRCLLPDAPERPVTLNGGITMRAWFDIRGFGPDAPVDQTGLDHAIDTLARQIEAEQDARETPFEVLVIGFSQGASLALHALLAGRIQPTALLAFSGFLLSGARNDPGSTIPSVPVFWAHGRNDPVVPYALAQKGMNQLTARGVAIHHYPFPGEHALPPEALGEANRWLEALSLT